MKKHLHPVTRVPVRAEDGNVDDILARLQELVVEVAERYGISVVFPDKGSGGEG